MFNISKINNLNVASNVDNINTVENSNIKNINNISKNSLGYSTLNLPAMNVYTNWTWNNSYRPSSSTANSFSYSANNTHRDQGFRWQPSQLVVGGYFDFTVRSSTAVSYTDCGIFTLYNKSAANVHTATYYNRGTWYGYSFGLRSSSNMYTGPVTGQYYVTSYDRKGPLDFNLAYGSFTSNKRFIITYLGTDLRITSVDTDITILHTLTHIPNSIFFGFAVYTSGNTVYLTMNEGFFLY